MEIRVEGFYTDRCQMEHYDGITGIPTGPIPSEPEPDE
jgi:hypothetical protein